MAGTVTATSSSTSAGLLLRVYCLTGAASAQNGASATQSANAAHQVSITPTQIGSQIYGAILNGAASNPTMDANSTLIDGVADSSHTKDYVSWKLSATTSSLTATTCGSSAPTNNNGGCAAYEVLRAGTIAQDASSPPVVSTTTATTLTTASFTPAAAVTVLIALISGNGGTNATITMTVSDTLGLGLTWTAQAQAHASNMKYAGVFTAVMPAAAAPMIVPPRSWQPVCRASYW